MLYRELQSFTSLKRNILKNTETSRHYAELAGEYELVDQVIKARLTKGLSQKTLADRVGTKQSAVSRLESGSYNPSISFLRKVAKPLDINLHSLIE
jgi:ribosome-binding protein aMBF1 (putative translation factor)